MMPQPGRGATPPAHVSPRVHWLQHVPFEGLGAIGPWLAERGARVTATRCHAAEDLPALDDFDWLIVMGGPMSVHDRDRYPWLAAEQRLVADAIAAGRTVLGICLGAQLIAQALGARVFRAPERETGWFPIEPVAPPTGHPFADLFSRPDDVFHWHGETFDLPAGAVPLARSAACAHQAFALGSRVLALQFHLEMTPGGARALIEHCPDDLAPGPCVQPAAAILSDESRFRDAHTHMGRVLDALDRARRAAMGATP
jgi:GMP synthase-like glutamine amidotransferase